jgi:hypothetical protein
MASSVPCGKTFLLAKFRVFQFFSQQLEEVLAPRVVTLEGLAEAFDGGGGGFAALVLK